MARVPLPIAPTTETSFAFFTISERLPEILVKALDYFHRTNSRFIAVKHPDLKEIKKQEIEEESKAILGAFSKLRYEMMTDKQIPLLSGKHPDIPIWNNYHKQWTNKLGKEPTFFTVSWLYAECFMYRKIQEIFDESQFFTGFDSFYEQKRKALINSLPAAIALGEYLSNYKPNNDANKLKQEMTSMIEVALWGNKCDLSLTAGAECTSALKLSEMEKFRPNILINNTHKLIDQLMDMKELPLSTLDIVLDNAGFELFTDLCLVEFLHKSGVLQPDKCKVRFYVKNIPWFVSDARRCDFQWTINYLKNKSQSQFLQDLGVKFDKYLSLETWYIMEDDFFTSPFDYSMMKSTRPSLYSKLSEAQLILFKGDLNYRKLVGDLQWDNLAKFKTALRGFCPSNLCALRSIKAEVCVGFENVSQWSSLPSDWMKSSDYAVIQYLPRED